MRLVERKQVSKFPVPLSRASLRALHEIVEVWVQSLLEGQQSIAVYLRGKPRLPQAFRDFVGNVASAGELVRRAGVVKQLAVALEHPGELVIEDLGVKLAGR